MMDAMTAMRGERLPMRTWVQTTVADLPGFIDRLRVSDTPARYLPATAGVLPTGAAIGLGYTALAVKLHVLLGTWERMTEGEREAHVGSIRSYQTEAPSPESYWGSGAFVDAPLVDSLVRSTSLSPSPVQQVSTIRNAVRAESKQAIASLIQVGASPRFRYTDLPDSVEGVRFFLESFDWPTP